jgi:ABC-type sugar transport system permease subunit
LLALGLFLFWGAFLPKNVARIDGEGRVRSESASKPIWISYPFILMMSAAALEAVGPSLYEASRIDGSSPRQQLIYIRLPVTARSIYIGWILRAMFSVNDFATIYLLTGGGSVSARNWLVVMAYRTVFFRVFSRVTASPSRCS